MLAPGDAVLGLSRNGEAAAYPIRLLNWHEVANDVVEGDSHSVVKAVRCSNAAVGATEF